MEDKLFHVLSLKQSATKGLQFCIMLNLVSTLYIFTIMVHNPYFTILLIITTISLFRVYGEPIPIKELADRVASYVHLCTLYWWLR